ncbi:hypothetical protein BGZ76_002649 [Entomortierella beljakovae]|nr:hypothetical protein BGZ76_002649 [Entomortierella beljakovae]
MSDYYHCHLFFSNPEPQQILASFVSTNDLLKCIQVSTSWHKAFMPYLWKTFSDENCYLRDRENISQLKRAFKKHAHLIKDLTVTSHFLQKVVIEEKTNHSSSPQQGLSLQGINDPTGRLLLNSLTLTIDTAAARFAHQCWEILQSQPQLKSLVVQKYEDQKDPFERSLSELIVANPGSLTSITNLKLNIHSKNMQFPPVIQRYTGSIFYNSTEFTQNSSLRYVKLESKVDEGSFMNLLRSASGLNSLSINGIDMDENEGDEYDGDEEDEEHWKSSLIATRYQGISSQLQILECDSPEEWHCEDLALFIRFLPNLVKFTVKYLPLKLSRAIAENCKSIQSIQVQVEKDLIPEIEFNNNDVITPLLTSCPDLLVLDAAHHRLHAKNVPTQPWVCGNLQELHCQITRFPGIIENSLIRMNNTCNRGKNYRIEKEDTTVKLKTRDLRQKVFKQISMMTLLKKLTISSEYRSCSVQSTPVRILGLFPEYSSVRDGKKYYRYNEFEEDTLSMSLDDGLDQLSNLTQLESIGFEFADHKMEKKEIKWIAENMPNLKEMRGLLDAPHYRLEPNYKNGELRMQMMKLRPDIKHTQKCIIVYNSWTS